MSIESLAAPALPRITAGFLAAVEVTPTTVPTTQPDTVGTMLFLAVLLAIGLATAGGVGVFRRFSIADAPERLAVDRPAWPAAVALVVGLAAWLGLQVGYGFYRAAEWGAAGNAQPMSAADFTAADYAWLATIPAAAGFLAFLVADALCGRLHRPLGYAPPRVPAGIALGVVGAIIILPVVLVASNLLEWLYHTVGYEHPTEHDLLRVMTDADQRTRLLLIVGAAVGAPVFEEMLFRGHLQTLFVWLFDRITRPRRPAEGFPVIEGPPPLPPLAAAPVERPDYATHASPLPPPPVPMAVLPLEPELPNPRRDARVRWAAVVVASLLFAIVHPLWTVPLIFVLSLGLGYAYERTGNLWVPIVIHAIFNGSQTLIFLGMRE
jgi:membrane protease YdiL (CAAX protease family)